MSSLKKALQEGGEWSQELPECQIDDRWFTVVVTGEVEIIRDGYRGRERPRNDDEIIFGWDVCHIDEENEDGDLVARFEPEAPEFDEIWSKLRRQVTDRISRIGT